MLNGFSINVPRGIPGDAVYQRVSISQTGEQDGGGTLESIVTRRLPVSQDVVLQSVEVAGIHGLQVGKPDTTFPLNRPIHELLVKKKDAADGGGQWEVVSTVDKPVSSCDLLGNYGVWKPGTFFLFGAPKLEDKDVTPLSALYERTRVFVEDGDSECTWQHVYEVKASAPRGIEVRETEQGLIAVLPEDLKYRSHWGRWC